MDATTKECWKQLTDVVREYAGIADITITESMDLVKDLKFDSLNEVEFCICVEETFNMPISEEEADRLSTIGDYFKLIKSKKGIQ